MAASIVTIDISDIPIAVRNACFRSICLLRMTVSRAIEVNNPFMIANTIMVITGQSISINWKYAMVPRSPMEQPSRHHAVFFEATRHVLRHDQLTRLFVNVLVIFNPIILSTIWFARMVCQLIMFTKIRKNLINQFSNPSATTNAQHNR